MNNSHAISTEIIASTPVRSSVNIDLKIAREQRRIEEVRAAEHIIKTLLDNPAFDVLVAYIILEILAKNHVVAGGLEEGICMTAVTATVSLKQIAPLLPDILKSGSEGAATLLKAVGSLAPIFAAA